MSFRKIRLLMSKYGFSILFMGFELWLSFAAFFWLNEWFPNWMSVTIMVLLYISTILAIVNRNMPPESKVTWLLIAVIPVFGSLLYLMFGERRLCRSLLFRVTPQRVVETVDVGGDLQEVHRTVAECGDGALNLVVARAREYDKGNSERRSIAAVVGEDYVEGHLTTHFGSLRYVVRGFDGITFVCESFAERLSHTF